MPSATAVSADRPGALARPLGMTALLVCMLLFSASAGVRPAAAAESAAPQSRAVVVPGFWDPRRRPERPDLSRLQTIRFLTETDYPPFDYTNADGNPAGFNVDLARLICDEIKVSCTIQIAPLRRSGRGAQRQSRRCRDRFDLPPAPRHARRVDFSDPYYRTPARFVARLDSRVDDVLPERLEGKKVAVVAGTAHEAYLKTMFTEVEVRPYPNRRGGARAVAGAGRRPLVRRRHLACVLAQRQRFRRLLRRSAAARSSRAAFSARASASPCKRGNDLLRQALNWALFRLWEKGSFTDLWLRYFPISPF